MTSVWVMHYLIIFKKLCAWREEMLKNSFWKNNTMGPLKGISPFAPKIFKSTVFTVTQVLWKYLWEHAVQAIIILLCEDFLSSDITLLPDSELVLLWEIRKLITLESASFKLDPELNPLNDHPLFPCRTIKNFLSFFISHRDLTSLKKMKTPKWIEKKSIKMGEKKKEEKMEMSTIKQKKRKEDFSESKYTWLCIRITDNIKIHAYVCDIHVPVKCHRSHKLVWNW